MNRHGVFGVVLITVLVLAAGAWAQEPSLSINFPFAAAGKVLAAGNYSVATASNGNVVLTPDKGGAAVEIPLIKTISRRNVQRPELVFDQVGSVWFLTEVWLPGKGGSQVGKELDYSQDRKTVKGLKAK